LKESSGLKGRDGLLTVGMLPVVLTGISLIAFWRNMLAWGLCLLLFGWLILAHHAPVDLLKLMWNLPVFEAIYRPYKYFSFQIAFTFAIAAGQCFSLLRQLQPRWLEGFIALTLIAFAIGFLYPKAERIQRNTYTYSMPTVERPREDGFFQVEGNGLQSAHPSPPRSLAYFNLQENIGTIDWYTGIPLPSAAVPKYFVDAKNDYIPNPEYRGEAFFLEATNSVSPTAQAIFQPNSITLRVEVKTPGTLIINQNFHRDWHVDHGTLSDYEGRLALRLQETGNYEIHLRYRPRSFYAGLVVTILSLLALACVSWFYGSGRLRKWSEHGSPIPQTTSLWLVA
jgi:hypothetical protein